MAVLDLVERGGDVALDALFQARREPVDRIREPALAVDEGLHGSGDTAIHDGLDVGRRLIERLRDVGLALPQVLDDELTALGNRLSDDLSHTGHFRRNGAAAFAERLFERRKAFVEGRGDLGDASRQGRANLARSTCEHIVDLRHGGLDQGAQLSRFALQRRR